MKLIIIHTACGGWLASGRDVSRVDVYLGCAGSRQGGLPDGHRDEVQTQVGVGGRVLLSKFNIHIDGLDV